MRHGLEDPFAQELIAVPAKGVERWLTQRLSHSSDPSGAEAGVCANVRFTSSRTLIDEVAAAVVGETDDAWTANRMLFGLLALDGPGREAAHGWRLPPDRPVAAASDLADLFVAYATQRPDLLRAWAAGTDDELPE